jgi:hypothetical protein
MKYIKFVFFTLLAILFIFSGCSAAPHTHAKSADQTTVSSIPVSPVGFTDWKITQEQAIDIASTYIPSNVLNHASISICGEGTHNPKTGVSAYYWNVDFGGISVAPEELGWQSDSQTTLDPGPDGNYTEIIVGIDAVTGDLGSRAATFAWPAIGESFQNSFYPINGATNIPVSNLTFTWAAVAGVTYQFALAQASANSPSNEFANIDYSDITLTNAEPCQETLQYNTVYYWEVRQVTLDSKGAVTTAGPCSIQQFTTVSATHTGPTTPIYSNSGFVFTIPDTIPTIWAMKESPTYQEGTGTATISTGFLAFLSNPFWIVIAITVPIIIGLVIALIVTVRHNR